MTDSRDSNDDSARAPAPDDVFNAGGGRRRSPNQRVGRRRNDPPVPGGNRDPDPPSARAAGPEVVPDMTPDMTTWEPDAGDASEGADAPPPSPYPDADNPSPYAPAASPPPGGFGLRLRRAPEPVETEEGPPPMPPWPSAGAGPMQPAVPQPYARAPMAGPRPGPVSPPGHAALGDATFARRAPRYGPQPDEHGFYPSDYYVGPDWMRIVVGSLVGFIVLVGGIAGTFYMVDRFDPRDEETTKPEPTATPLPLVPVYQCAGDDAAVNQMTPPTPALIAGRTADSRWLAFRNPEPPPFQLWIRATSVPDFDPTTVGIVSCAGSSTEFPTPAGAPGVAPDDGSE